MGGARRGFAVSSSLLRPLIYWALRFLELTSSLALRV